MSLSIKAVMKMTFLSITEFKLLLMIELLSVSSEIRLRGFAGVHFLSARYVLITASTLESFYQRHDALFG